MYCPKCELEIKGEDQQECPICNSALIENPFEDMTKQNLIDDSDPKLKELIADIDQKVSKNLEESAAEEELISKDFSKAPEEPLESEFNLEMEEDQTDTQIEQEEEQAFMLSAEEPVPVPEEPPVEAEEPITPAAEEELPEAQLEMEPQEPEEPEEVAAEEFTEEERPPIDMEKEISEAELVGETPEGEQAAAEPYDMADQLSTKEMLDRALDELDSTKAPEPPPPKPSGTRGVVLALVAIIAIIFGAYFLIYQADFSKQTLPPEQKIAKKEDKIIQKAVKRDDTTVTKKTEPAAEKKAPAVTEKVPEKDIAIKEPEKKLPPTEPVKVAVKKVPGKPAAVPQKQEVAKKEPVKQKAQAEKQAAAPPAGTYAIHAGSFRKKISADGEANRFKKKGFDAYSVRTDLGKKGVWYRIKIGKYGSVTEAKKAQKDFQSTFKKVSTRIVKN